MREILIAISLLTMICGIPAAGVEAQTISRWVDDNGVTHFTDARLAPADALNVEVEPANGMDVPVVPQSATANPSTGPTFTKIGLPPKHNQKGWRAKRESIYTGRKYGASDDR